MHFNVDQLVVWHSRILLSNSFRIAGQVSCTLTISLPVACLYTFTPWPSNRCVETEGFSDPLQVTNSLGSAICYFLAIVGLFGH